MTTISTTTSVDRTQERSRLIVSITEQVAKVMREQEVSKAELARRLDVTPSFVTKLMSGMNNFTVSTLADVFTVLGQSVAISVHPRKALPEATLPEQWSEGLEVCTAPQLEAG